MNNFNQYGFPNMAQPYGYQMPNYNWQTQQQNLNTNKIYVSGVEDVKQRYVPNNGDMIFIHNDKDILYQKKVDSSGHYEINTFDIVTHKENDCTVTNNIDLSEFVSKKEFDDFKKKFLTSKIEDKGESNGTNTRKA